MTHDEEMQMLLNNIHKRRDISAEDGKWYALLSHLIPDFEQYENKALEMVKKLGLIKALKTASKTSYNTGLPDAEKR